MKARAKSDGNSTDVNMARRRFLRAAVATTAFTIIPRHVLGQTEQAPPSEKINVAVIGTGGQGNINLKQLLRVSDVHIAALCDVNTVSDYKAFYYGGTAGLQPALDLVSKERGQACPGYRDYREMLDKEDIDAVLLATPDHSHAAVALDVLAKGKHLYCEKPLCRTVSEARAVTEAARRAKVATQMGNQGHSGEGIRLTCEWIWDGAIGDVQEVHVWAQAGGAMWTTYKDRPEDTPPVPEGFDWERWLHPAPFRPYHPAYAPVTWRSWWQFGTGAIGDFACHHVDPAFWALKINEAQTFSVEACGNGTTDEVFPNAQLIYYDVPARAGMPPVHITWYDGGLMPPCPKELAECRKMGDNGILFVGSKGTIIAGGWGGTPRIIPEAKMQAYERPPKSLRRTDGPHRDWIKACKGEIPASSNNFDYAGPLTEFVLMGNVALLARKKLEIDWPKIEATNYPDANKFFKPLDQ